MRLDGPRVVVVCTQMHMRAGGGKITHSMLELTPPRSFRYEDVAVRYAQTHAEPLRKVREGVRVSE